jgi:single-stranded-DNA-specific exonuclease
VSHDSYKEGVIGLIAGKMVEEFYRPSIAVSIGDIKSKGSVRSISGFNIIEFLRLHTDHFINVGGHPMAAGFTVETAKLPALQEILEKKAEELLGDELLQRILKIDCELPLTQITEELYTKVQALAPFGMGNPEPTFMSKEVTLEDMRFIGKEGNHVKLLFSQEHDVPIEGIAFNMRELFENINIGQTINIAYTVDLNIWNGTKRLQLKIKDIRS